MAFETVFSFASLIAIVGWLMLLASPWLPRLSDRIAGTFLPVVLSIGYLVVFALPSAQSGGGFDSLTAVMELFSNEKAMLAGWLHYLAFDLFVGAWICRAARSEGIRFLFVLPSLPMTFLFGPLGLLFYLGTRAIHSSALRRSSGNNND